MKNIVDRLRDEDIIFRSLKELQPKEFGSRKKINIYLGVERSDYYAIVISISKKSRILKKEAGELMEFHSKLESKIDSKIKNKYIVIQAPLCSKAKALFEENGWRVIV